MNGILLDTHTWYWFANGSDKLKKQFSDTINKNIQLNKVFLSSISLWEISMLASKQRIVLKAPCLEWLNVSLDATKTKLIDLLPEIATDSTNLPGNFHGDPADRLIVASARVKNLTLLTRDKNIIRYSKDKHVNVVAI